MNLMSSVGWWLGDRSHWPHLARFGELVSSSTTDVRAFGCAPRKDKSAKVSEGDAEEVVVPAGCDLRIRVVCIRSVAAANLSRTYGRIVDYSCCFRAARKTATALPSTLYSEPTYAVVDEQVPVEQVLGPSLTEIRAQIGQN